MYFCWELLRIFKTIHFWKRYYGIGNQKSDVGILTDAFMAAILDYKMAAITLSISENRIRPLREPKLLNRFWWNSAWLTMSGSLLHMTTLVGISSTWVVWAYLWHVTSLEFLLIGLFFLSRSHKMYHEHANHFSDFLFHNVSKNVYRLTGEF